MPQPLRGQVRLGIEGDRQSRVRYGILRNPEFIHHLVQVCLHQVNFDVSTAEKMLNAKGGNI
jgi:hypothetical protein